MAADPDVQREVVVDADRRGEPLQGVAPPGDDGAAAEGEGLLRRDGDRTADRGQVAVHGQPGTRDLKRLHAVGEDSELGAGGDALHHDAGTDSGAIHGPVGGEASRRRVQPVAVGHPGVHGQPVAHVVAALDDPGQVEPGAPVIRGDEALHPAIPPAGRPLAVERPHTTVERILQKYRLVGPANGPPGEDGAPAGGHRHDAFVVLGQLDRDLMAKIATVALPAGSHPHRLLEVGQHLAVVDRSIAAHGLGLAEIGAKRDGEHRVGAPVPVHAVLGLEHDAVGAGAADDDLRASGAGDDVRRHPHLDRLGAGGELSGSGRDGAAGESGDGQHPDIGEPRCTHP